MENELKELAVVAKLRGRAEREMGCTLDYLGPAYENGKQIGFYYKHPEFGDRVLIPFEYK